MPGESPSDRDLSLQPPRIIVRPAGAEPVLRDEACPDRDYRAVSRLWQGIPGIERAPGRRLWATWYSGGEGECPLNYVVLVTSGDDGASWSAPVLVIDPPAQVRAYDPCLWHDPKGRLWLFLAQSFGMFDGRCGVWAVRCEDSAREDASWSEPRRLCNGIMMNKPTVLSTGEWLLPAAVWDRAWTNEMVRDESRAAPPDERRSNVIRSTDEGETWDRIGGAEVPERTPDEHMIVERRDGTLWMLVRTRYGIGESISTDRGVTWSPGRPTEIKGPDSRFFIRRLRSGRLLLVNHDNADARSRLTVWLSEDDGLSWIGGLMLDEREGVSYPDGVEAEDGRVYVIYDHGRHEEKEILMAVFSEDDVLAPAGAAGTVRLRVLVNRAGVQNRGGDS